MDDSARQIVEKAIELAAKGDFREAIELLYEVVERFPNFIAGYELIGDLYLKIAKPDLAIRPLEMALEINPDRYLTHFLLGCAYGRMLRFEEALEELEIARQMRPDDSEILRNMGWVSCMAGDVIRGREILYQALEMNPDNGLIYNDLAASYLFTSDRDLHKAGYWLEKALEVEPDEPFIQETYAGYLEILKSRKSIDPSLLN